jgi:hypothetical protein
MAIPAIAEELPKQPNLERIQILRNQRTFVMNCINGAIDRFDDHISPANVVASAVAWYCEAEGDPEKYWIIPSSRRSTPDTIDAFYRDLALLFVIDAFYRDLALLFVLQHRAKQLSQQQLEL